MIAVVGNAMGLALGIAGTVAGTSNDWSGLVNPQTAFTAAAVIAAVVFSYRLTTVASLRMSNEDLRKSNKDYIEQAQRDQAELAQLRAQPNLNEHAQLLKALADAMASHEKAAAARSAAESKQAAELVAAIRRIAPARRDTDDHVD